MKMKKILALALAGVMTLSMGMVAFAAGGSGSGTENYTDQGTVTITKIYEAANGGTTSPAETFNFTIERTSVSDAAEGITAANMPIPTIGSVEYAKGEAGSANKSKDITITLPSYESVGVYTYTIKETAGDTAGVSYFGNDITLVVTVIEQNGKLRVAAVHTEEQGAAEKSDEFTNTYSAGSLEVKKQVTGILGDKDKEFTVTVTFTAPEGKSVKEAISYKDGTEDKTIEANWSNNTATAVITLKHDETVTFTNIPYGVTYTVEEDSYKGDGYDDAVYQYSDSAKEIDTASDQVTITNNKGGNVDTGINLDNLPYILMLCIAAFGAAALFFKKRRMLDR